MNDDFYNEYDEYPSHDSMPEFDNGRFDRLSAGGMGWIENLRHLWQWDELAAEIGQESQARVAFVGLKGAGKSLLFNRLRGWVISETASDETAVAQQSQPFDLDVESLGLFVLADLPSHTAANRMMGPELLMALGDPALVVYLLDGSEGIRPDDFRWTAALRSGGKPLILALNKVDTVVEPDALIAEAVRKLGIPAIPISAETGSNVEDKLLPAMLDAVPRLAVPLGREISGLRKAAARRVIRQAAMLSGLMGAQPVPMLDIPLQAMVQVGVVMRVGAAFGHAPTGGMNREVMGTVISTLGLRYLALALVKFVPFVGWAVSGALCGGMTVLMGEAAIRYYEGGKIEIRNKKEEVGNEKLEVRREKLFSFLPSNFSLLPSRRGQHES
ncbi:MAG: GTP-binding protein [Chloroflexi bacterium]|nr:GTP-binding protein [Chloroflexota bacterium]